MREIRNTTNRQQYVVFQDGTSKYFLKGEVFTTNNKIRRHTDGLTFVDADTGEAISAYGETSRDEAHRQARKETDEKNSQKSPEEEQKGDSEKKSSTKKKSSSVKSKKSSSKKEDSTEE